MRPRTPYSQRGWAFLTLIPLRFPPVEFSSFDSLSFSSWSNSSFLLDFVQTSSRRVNPFHINELSQSCRFRKLRKHVLRSAVDTREFEPSSSRCEVVGTNQIVHWGTRDFKPLVRQFGNASGRNRKGLSTAPGHSIRNQTTDWQRELRRFWVSASPPHVIRRVPRHPHC